MLTISSCYSSIPLALGLIGWDGGLCHSYGFACQQKVLKTFPDPGYFRSKDGVVWLWLWLTISSWYGSIPLALGLIGRDGGLSTLCHGCYMLYIYNIYIYIYINWFHKTFRFKFKILFLRVTLIKTFYKDLFSWMTVTRILDLV